MFIAKEIEEVCSILFETKEKEDRFVEVNVFSLDTIEIDDKIIKYEAFIGSNDVKFSFACGEKKTFIQCSTKKLCPTTRKWKKETTYMTIYLKKMRN